MSLRKQVKKAPKYYKGHVLLLQGQQQAFQGLFSSLQKEHKKEGATAATAKAALQEAVNSLHACVFFQAQGRASAPEG